MRDALSEQLDRSLMRIRANDHVGAHLIACIFDAALGDFFSFAERSAHVDDCGLDVFRPTPSKPLSPLLLRKPFRFWKGHSMLPFAVCLGAEKDREKCAIRAHGAGIAGIADRGGSWTSCTIVPTRQVNSACLTSQGSTCGNRYAAENAVKWIVVPPGVVITKSQQKLAVFGVISFDLGTSSASSTLFFYLMGQRESLNPPDETFEYPDLDNQDRSCDCISKRLVKARQLRAFG